jgi:hypothetical protein
MSYMYGSALGIQKGGFGSQYSLENRQCLKSHLWLHASIVH